MSAEACDEWVNPRALVPVLDLSVLQWLDENPTSGSVGAGSCATVTVTFDSTGLAGGTYTGALEITSDDPDEPVVTVPVTLTVQGALSGVDFDWYPPTPMINEVVYFTATATGPGPITYEWDLGDGTMDSGPYVNHAYAVEDTYTVVMTATGACGDSVVVTHNVVVSAGCVEPAGADFTWTPITPTVGAEVTFSGSVVTGTAPLAYAWDLGDGSIGSGTNPTHTYAMTGTYTVIMTVTNDCGSVVATYDIVVVQGCTEPSGAAFTWLPLNPAAGQPVTFTGSASGGTMPFTFAWDFDDGTGAGSPVNHTYAVSGTYTVLMTVTNACGSDTATHDVTVSGAGPTVYRIYLPIITRGY
jgi:PKD repeat protein